MDLAERGPLGLKERVTGKDPKHLARVAELGCCICLEYGMPQISETQVHHVIHGRYGQKKVPDRMTIPLCRFHHTGGHPEYTAIHEQKQTWRETYGPDTGFISWVEQRLGEDK